MQKLNRHEMKQRSIRFAQHSAQAAVRMHMHKQV